MLKNNYYCYFIISSKTNKKYIGATSDLVNTIREYNSEYGKILTNNQSREWHYHTIIGKFENIYDVMSFIWYWNFRESSCEYIKNESIINVSLAKKVEILMNEKWDILDNTNIINKNLI